MGRRRGRLLRGQEDRGRVWVFLAHTGGTMSPFLLVSLLLFPAARPACPADTAVLQQDVDAAFQAYDDWAWGEFDRRVAEVRADLDCLTEQVPPEQAAEVHRLLARVAARTQDAALAVSSYLAVLAVDPTFEPALTIAPKGSLLRRAWSDARAAAPGESRPLRGTTWCVDGQLDAEWLPTERAALVQYLGSPETTFSWYLDGTGVPEDLDAMLDRQESRWQRARQADAPTTEALAAYRRETMEVEIGGSEGSASGGSDSHTMRNTGLALVSVGVGSFLASRVLSSTAADLEDPARVQTLEHAGLATGFGGLACGVVGGGLVLGAVLGGSW